MAGMLVRRSGMWPSARRTRLGAIGTRHVQTAAAASRRPGTPPARDHRLGSVSLVRSLPNEQALSLSSERTAGRPGPARSQPSRALRQDGTPCPEEGRTCFKATRAPPHEPSFRRLATWSVFSGMVHWTLRRRVPTSTGRDPDGQRLLSLLTGQVNVRGQTASLRQAWPPIPSES